MVNEIDKQLDSNDGKLDPQDFARMVVTLLVGDSAPIRHKGAGRCQVLNHLQCG
jgi:hypothetical protein